MMYSREWEEKLIMAYSKAVSWNMLEETYEDFNSEIFWIILELDISKIQVMLPLC
jgi:hypothetical protein